MKISIDFAIALK